MAGEYCPNCLCDYANTIFNGRLSDLEKLSDDPWHSFRKSRRQISTGQKLIRNFSRGSSLNTLQQPVTRCLDSILPPPIFSPVRMDI